MVKDINLDDLKILTEDKESYIKQAGIPEKNLFTADNANEIKNKHNALVEYATGFPTEEQIGEIENTIKEDIGGDIESLIFKKDDIRITNDNVDLGDNWFFKNYTYSNIYSNANIDVYSIVEDNNVVKYINANDGFLYSVCGTNKGSYYIIERKGEDINAYNYELYNKYNELIYNFVDNLSLIPTYCIIEKEDKIFMSSTQKKDGKYSIKIIDVYENKIYKTTPISGLSNDETISISDGGIYNDKMFFCIQGVKGSKLITRMFDEDGNIVFNDIESSKEGFSIIENNQFLIGSRISENLSTTNDSYVYLVNINMGNFVPYDNNASESKPYLNVSTISTTYDLKDIGIAPNKMYFTRKKVWIKK